MRFNFLPVLLALAWSLVVVASGRAQPAASLAANPTTFGASAGQIVLTASINYSAGVTPSALGYTVNLPEGWALVSTGGASVPQIRPPAGSTGALDYAYTASPATPASFTVTISYPADQVGNRTISSSAVYRDSTLTGPRILAVPDLTLTGPPLVTATAPTITTQPSNQTAQAGQSAGFLVVAAGTPSPTYQWRKSGLALAGKTSSTLTFADLTAADAGSYDVVVTNSAGSVTSSAAILTVTAATITPVIVTQPVSVVVTVGQTANFSVTASAAAALTYQWRRNGVPLVGRTGATLSLANVVSTDAGNYDVVVTTSTASVTSSLVTLTVNALPAAVPVIVTQPVNVTGIIGNPFTLSVSATSATPLTYQWRRDGASIVGATAATLTLVGAAAVAGDYSVVVTNSVGSVTSATASVQFGSGGGGGPVIALQPGARSLVVGERASLFVGTVGATAFQWFKDGVAIAGATSAELVFAPVTLSTAGAYRLAATGAGGTTTSATAIVTVSNRATLPAVVAQPAPQTVLVGSAVSFSVVATGNPAPTFQWRKDGADLPGATGATLRLANAQAAEAGGYDVVVRNASGVATSSLASLSFTTNATAPVISRQPADRTLAAGRAATLFVYATGAPEPAYQWSKDGVPLAGATASALTWSSVTAADTGRYAVTVTNSAGSVTSANAVLTVLRSSYAGSWFGTLGGGGTFALQVNDDNTAVLLAFAPGSRTAYVSRTGSVDGNGRFRFTAAATVGGPSTAAAPTEGVGAPKATAAGVELVVEGTIGDDGVLAGSLAGPTPVAFAATRSTTTGATAAVAGFYLASAAGGSAQTYAIIGPAGQAFVLLQSGTVLDAGTGAVDASGRFVVTTANQQTVAATVSAEAANILVAITDGKGTTTQFAGFAANAPALAEQRLVNISTRTTAGAGDQVAIVGFTIAGLESKPVLIRAVGPTLGSFGVATALSVPRLVLNRDSSVVGSNTGWTTSGATATIVAAAARSGAFPLGATSADSVLFLTLAPGSYTAVVSAADGKPGVGLVEVYDLSGASIDQKLTNISTRAVAGAGDATLIAGLVVGGSAPKRVLIRAAGPALAQFGLTGVLAQPQLTLVSGGVTIAQNAGWNTSADSALIADAAGRVGAFAFPAGSQDAALVVNLAPGSYTAQVTGAGGASGIVLLEVYELP